MALPERSTQAGQVVAATPNIGDHYAKTASYTVMRSDSGKIFSNSGAGGAVTFTLPAAQVGLHYRFVKVAAQNMTITATGGAKINGSAANGTFANTDNGEALVAHVKVYCPDNTNWFVSPVGTWATT